MSDQNTERLCFWALAWWMLLVLDRAVGESGTFLGDLSKSWKWVFFVRPETIGKIVFLPQVAQAPYFFRVPNLRKFHALRSVPKLLQN